MAYPTYLRARAREFRRALQLLGDLLGVEPGSIRLQLKSKDGQLRTRVWRCSHGVAAIDIHDTYFRARIGAWMARLKASWG